MFHCELTLLVIVYSIAKATLGSSLLTVQKIYPLGPCYKEHTLDSSTYLKLRAHPLWPICPNIVVNI